MFCIPVIAPDTEEAIKKMTEASARADVLELRLDLMEGFDLKRLMQAANKPVLATYRSNKEGGRGSDDPGTAGNILLSAVGSGVELADMELRLSGEWQRRIMKSKGNTKIVVSSHFFEGTPSREELKGVFQESVSTGGDVVKIVTMARDWEDILRVIEVIPMARREGIEGIAFCMGSIGRLSRVLAHLMGSYLTFTSLETGQESAPGQIPVEEMKALIKTFSH